jgi:hypothetical protein
MKKFIAILAALAGVVVLFVGVLAYTGDLSADRFIRAALNFRFGNFGGSQRGPGAEPFDAKAIKFGIRWYPTFVSFGPDNDTLLVDLCHVDNNSYCRMAKYSLSKDQWDVYAYDESYLYGWPLFSPDGQWIYYGTTKLCEDRRNFCGRPQIFRMRPDGTGVEMFAEGSMAAASFSIDGKRLIHWGGNNEVHMLDMATREDTRLTDKTYLMSSPHSRSFLTADGEHFIFPADFSDWQGKTSCAVDPKTIAADPKTGEKDFGPLFGDKEDTGLYLAAIKDAPITQDNCYKLTPIWGKNSEHPSLAPCAMDGQGRFLYSGDIKTKKSQGNPLALALRPANPNYKTPAPLTPEEYNRKYSFATLTEKQLREGEGARLHLREVLDDSDAAPGRESSASFLRPLDIGAPDEAAFDMGCGDFRDSISHDGNQLIFLWGSVGPSNDNAIAVLKQGESLKQVRLILNWPKLDLIPTLPTHR